MNGSSFRVYIHGQLLKTVSHPRVDMTPQAMRELLLLENHSPIIVVIKNTGIVRG